MTSRARTRRTTKLTRRSRGRKSATRGRRSTARLGRRYETVLAQPRQVKAGRGALLRVGLKPHQAVGLAFLLLLTAMICYLFLNSSFYVWDAEVTGLKWLDQEGVYRSARIDGSSIFYVDPLRIRATLEQMPSVESARVVCRLPNHVSIQITERTPAAIWQSQSTQYWVDGSGMLFSRSAELDNPLVIVEQNAVERRPGDQVDGHVVDAVIELHTLLPEVRIFGYSKVEGLQFELPNGRQVLTRVGCDSDKVVSALAALEQEFLARRIQPRVIDLRYETRAFWR